MKRIQEEFIGLVFISLFALSIPTFAQSVSGSISQVGEATHLEFEGLSDWKYETEIGEDRVSLIVPPFDDKTLVQLQTWSDKYIKNIEVDKNGPDKSYVVKFNLTSKEVEMFDYLTDEPSRLILDFYSKTPEPVTETKAKKPAKKVTTKLPEKSIGKSLDSKYKKVNRGIASSELLVIDPQVEQEVGPESGELYPQTGIFDSSDPDYSRFKLKDYQVKEESVISSRQNIYIQFPYLKMEKDEFVSLMDSRPEYEINKTDSKENKEARLLLTLYNNKRLASFEKVYNYFINKYPNSKYLEIVYNLAIETYADRYLKDNNRADYDKFRSILKLVLEKYPSSPLDQRNRQLLAYSAIRQGEALEAIREFDNYLKKYPLAEDKDRVNISRAQAFMILKKPEISTKIFSEVEAEAATEALAVEAAYRQGDVQMEFKNFAEAAKSYEKNLSKYPKYKSLYPNALYNLSESYFWLKDYKKSLDSFVSFLKNYPSHDHGGFALTRVGELLEILGADQRQIMGAFIEAYFRYPNNAGSNVARIRMLAGALRNMKDKQKKIALKEMKEITDASRLPQIEEFSTLMISDGLSKGREFEESLKLLESYYRQNPTTVSFDIFKSRILRNISDILSDKVESGQFLQALDFYGKYMPTWLKQSNRIDTDFYQAEAFERAGVYAEAEKKYKTISERLKKISGTNEEKERKVYENLPSQESVKLRLAAVALEQSKYRDAYSYLRGADKNLSEKEQIEKVQIGAEVAKQSGDTSTAIAYLNKLIKNWKGQSNLLAEPYLKLGRLYLDQKKTDSAANIISQIEALPKSEAESSGDLEAKSLQLKGDILLAQGKSSEAVSTYVELLEKYDGKRPLDSVRYQAGKIKFENGDIKGAEQIWSRLEEGKSSLYSQLANEKLNQSEWQDNYQKYINRIPAANELK